MIAAMSQLHLMRPEWLWAGLPAIILAILLWRLRNRSGGWSEVIAPELLPYLVGKTVAGRSPNLLPFIYLAWLLAVLAASGPSWEKIPQPIHQKRDAMVLVLDLSYSMLAGDLSPSRLARAQQKLLDLLKLRREGQTGLIAYAGDSHIVTPLTDDNSTIANLLSVLSPRMMPMPGSNASAAIAQAIDLLHSGGITQGQIVLVTDGVDSRAQSEIEDLLSGSGIRLTVLAVGTEPGAPIPLAQGGFLKDDSGTIVIPKLDRDSLAALASVTGGDYLNLQIDDSDLRQLRSDIVLPGQEQTVQLDQRADSWDDKGYLLILLLLPLALPLFRRGWVLSVLPLVLFSLPEQAQALTWEDLWYTADQQGQRALQNGDAKEAAKLFDDREWAGTAAYQSEEFKAAAERFAGGDTANDWYNRGNALAKAGEIDDAIAAYKESLQRQPDQTDAIENLALLEQQKQQQEQEQEQEQDQEQDQEQEQQDSEDSEQQSEDDGEPQESDQQQNGEQDPSEEQPDPEESDESQDESESEEQPPEEEEQPEGEPEEEPAQTEEQESAQAQAEESSPEEQEQEQAMQQWLRRIPDDPSGLLREKFRYESQQRLEQGETRQNEILW